MPDRPMRWGRGHIEPEPKPFGKVTITRDKARNRLIGHERFAPSSYNGKVTLLLTALTPIHVGSGIYELEKDEPVRGLITTDGKVIVPGTSLKGAIRSIAEAISDSCMRILRGDIKENLAKGVSPCDEIKPSTREKGREPKLCVCCSIFGALGYQGRISFTDAHLVTESGTAIHSIKSPYQPRPSARFYLDAQRRFNGRKFYFHGQPVDSKVGEPYQVIVPNSELECSLEFESLTAAELCLLFVAMGIFDDIIIKIGGGKQAMLGSIEIMPTRLELRKSLESFLDFSEANNDSKEVLNEGIVARLLNEVGKANQLVNEEAVDELIKIWQWPSNRKAPTTIY
ncbi:MAG: RAMP superfamily CRISPR-associated protein [Blastocatellia bacterium]